MIPRVRPCSIGHGVDSADPMRYLSFLKTLSVARCESR